MSLRKPQWDDWRCYRCNRWRSSTEKRTPHQTPVGLTVSICERCAAEAKAMNLTCTICGTRFEGKPRNVGVNVFCSLKCSNAGKRAAMRGTSGLAHYQLTDLNRQTTLRWLACIAAGTHRPGETFTGIRTWQGYDAPMPICDTCAVPLPDLSVAFRFSGEAA